MYSATTAKTRAKTNWIKPTTTFARSMFYTSISLDLYAETEDKHIAEIFQKTADFKHKS
jgi:hypothetical protein